MTSIESNIPLVEKSRIEYPFERMQVGDSFFIASKSNRTKVGAAMVYYSKKLGAKYTQRTLGDGIRVWRIK